MTKLVELYGSDVFNDEVMRERLPKPTYRALCSVIAGKAPLTPDVAGEAIDSMRWPEILGTLSGDNTIMVVVRADTDSADVQRKFEDILK